MNTNKALTIFLVVQILSAGHAICASQDSTNTIQLSKEQFARVETNIARAIIWQMYWRDGKSIAQIRKQIANTPSTPFTLCQVKHEDLCVYLDAYQWKVVLAQIGTEHYDFDVVEYKLEADKPAEIRRIYLDNLSCEPAVIAKGTLILHPEDLSVLTFEKPGQKQYSVVTNTLTKLLLSSEKSEKLRERIVANKGHGPLIVHIGGLNKQSPWVYYYIEGIPYVGMMLIDPSSGEFIHDDFLYIHENYRETEYKNMRRAIDENGTKFILNLSMKSSSTNIPSRL